MEMNGEKEKRIRSGAIVITMNGWAEREEDRRSKYCSCISLLDSHYQVLLSLSFSFPEELQQNHSQR